MGVLLGLFGAFSFALADFSGGLATRRISPFVTTMVNQVIGIPVMVALLFWLPATRVTAADVLYGVGSGVGSTVGLVMLYRVLSQGSMGPLAAITGVMSAAVPLVFAVTRGESLGPAGIAGVIAALASIVLVAGGPSEPHLLRAHRVRVALATVAGLIFGVAWVLLASVSQEAGAVPLISLRVAAAGTAAVAVGALGAFVFDRRSYLQAGLAGIASAGAMLAFLLASYIQEVGIVSVLQGLAPVFTALLAWVVLRQKLAPNERRGVLVAVLAVTLLALD